MYEQSELDYRIYNDLTEYTDLILSGDSVKYLKTITVDKPLQNRVTR